MGKILGRSGGEWFESVAGGSRRSHRVFHFGEKRFTFGVVAWPVVGLTSIASLSSMSKLVAVGVSVFGQN